MKYSKLKTNKLSCILVICGIFAICSLFLSIPGFYANANDNNDDADVTSNDVNDTRVITFQGNGGAWGTEQTKPVTETIGEHFVLPENPTWEGHVFRGWFHSATSEIRQITDKTIVPETLLDNIYAHWWTVDKCTITSANGKPFRYTVDGDLSQRGEASSYTCTSIDAIYCAANYEFDKFKRWKVLIMGSDSTTHYVYIDNLDGYPITNIFASGHSATVTVGDIVPENKVEWTFNANNGAWNNESVKVTEQYYSLIVQFPEQPVRENYNFVGWFTEPEGGVQLSDFEDFVEDTTPKTVYAHWESSVVPPEPEPINPGEEINATIPQTGDYFDNNAILLIVISIIAGSVLFVSRRINLS